MIEAVISGVIAFAATNIDDLFIDMLFYAEADTRKKVLGTVLGKYLGIGIITAVSMLAAFGFGAILPQYIALLGIVPIILGIKYVADSAKDKNGTESSKSLACAPVPVMLVTIANSADNMGVYVPLFAGAEPWRLLVFAAVFGVMTGLWCFLGKTVVRLPLLRAFLGKHRRLIIPAVYILLGIYVIVENLWLI